MKQLWKPLALRERGGDVRSRSKFCGGMWCVLFHMHDAIWYNRIRHAVGSQTKEEEKWIPSPAF